MGGQSIESFPSTSFVCKRINKTTFLIIEDDAYDEQPHVYVKIYPGYLLITDTGCNTPRSKDRSVVSLREYLELYPLPLNNNQALNPNGERKYVIICSHCHYDHTLGIPQFSSTKPTIIASGFEKSFLLRNFAENSLCKYVGVAPPQYNISHWANHMEVFSLAGFPFRIQCLQTPGHTPDSLAWYDIDEHHLYVGDTFYENKRSTPIAGLPEGDGTFLSLPGSTGSIIFVIQGSNWIQYMASLSLLLSFVRFRNEELKRQHGSSMGLIPKVSVGCGHLTYDADAEGMILEVQALFRRIIAGKIPPTGSGERQGKIWDHWLESKDSRFSVVTPRFIVEEARKHFHPSM